MPCDPPTLLQLLLARSERLVQNPEGDAARKERFVGKAVENAGGVETKAEQWF